MLGPFRLLPPESKEDLKLLRRRLPTVNTPEEFERSQINERVFGKQYTVYINDEQTQFLEYNTEDGAHKRNTTQVFLSDWTLNACSCSEFATNKLGYCEHVAVAFLLNFRFITSNMGLLSAFHVRIRKLQASWKYFQGQKYRVWSSKTDSVIVIGNKKEPVDSVGVGNQVIAEDYVNRFNTRLAELKQAAVKSEGLLNEKTLYAYQEDIFLKMLAAKRCICSMIMGSGKAQPLSAKILTPNGWTTMGKIKVGDLVIGSNGTSTEVLGVFPQGKKPIYQVTMNDGSTTQSCDEHLWNVNTAARKHQSLPSRVLSLREIRETLIDGSGNRQHFIPMMKPVSFQKKELLVDPYLLGCLIGDGNLSTKNRIGFTSADEELVQALTALLPENVCFKKVKQSKYDYRIVAKTRGQRNTLVGLIKQLNLSGKRSWEKTVPVDYLLSSIEDRVSLLQGLLDTDGGLSGGVIEYSSTSLELTNQVKELVMSLGGNARVTSRTTQYTYLDEKKNGRLSYRVFIRLPNEIKPFRLERKANLVPLRTKYFPSRSIEAIDYVGEMDAQCISVAAQDHLYVTDDFIVTHNTITSIATFAELLRRVNPEYKLLIVAPKSLKAQWTGEIKNEIGFDVYQIDSAPDIAKYMESGAKIGAVTYQLIARYPDLFAEMYHDMVIFDEMQFVRNNETKTWKALAKMKAEYILGLSGTIIENRLGDLYSVMEILAPGYLGPEWKFNADYQILQNVTKSVIHYRGTKNIDKLQVKLKPFVFSYDDLKITKTVDGKSEAAIIKHCYHEVVLSPAERSIHDDYMEKANVLMAKGMNSPLTFGEKAILQSYLLKARQATDTRQLIDKHMTDISSGKLDKLIKLVKEHRDMDEKIVIFSSWTEMLDIVDVHIRKRLKNVSTTFFTGKQSAKQRKAAVLKFQTDPKCKVFLASDAGGLGLDGLQLIAKTVLHTELPWNPSKLDQRNARVFRIGQTQDVTAHYLIGIDTIETSIMSSLYDKRAIRQEVLYEEAKPKKEVKAFVPAQKEAKKLVKKIMKKMIPLF